VLNLFKQTRNGAALAFGGLLSAGWYISANSLLSGTAMHSLAVAGAIVIAGITPMWVSSRAMAKRASSQNRSLSQRLMAFDRHVLVNVVDTQGKLTEVNDQMLQVTGYALDTLVGQPVSMLYADNEGHNLAHAISKCLRRGETWQGETPLRCADGRVIVTHSTIIPLFDSKGKWTGSIAARTDITRMMKLLGEHETIETLDELRDDIWILDADTQNFTYMNKSALSRLKWSHDSLREQGIRDIAPLEVTSFDKTV
jgi:PAS domain S-box-containing protein